MTTQADSWTIGVEEEYQLINPTTRELQGRAQRTLEQAQAVLGDAVQPELQHSQIETVTPVCQTLTDVRHALVRLRQELILIAAREGNQLAAAGTHPFSRWDTQQITPKARYQQIAHQYGHLARELVICGCHVHVGLSDREMMIGVLNRVRVWLAPLLALAANSPFWLGEDTRYASYRTELWGRWPMAGPPHLFTSRDEYETLIHALVATGSIADASNIYWDVRLPERFPTVEFRVADVCLTVDEAVMVTGLVRALAQRCYQQAVDDAPFVAVRPELLRMAHWRAARYGLEGELIDVQATQSVPAPQLVEQLLIFVRPALEASGDWEDIAMLVRETLHRGNGAMRQRAVFERAGRIEDVVDFIVAETASG